MMRDTSQSETVRTSTWKLNAMGCLAFALGVAFSVGLALVRLLLIKPGQVHIDILPVCVWFLVGLIPLVVLHEALHAIGARLMGIGWDRIKIGFLGRSLLIVCEIKGVFEIRHARFFTVLPLLVTGAVFAVLIAATGEPIFVLLLATAIGISGGDLYNLWQMRGYQPKDSVGNGDDLLEGVVVRRSPDGETALNRSDDPAVR